MRILLFGHIGSNRCVEALYRAMARVARNVPLHLDIVGDIWNERLLRDLAANLGIAGQVSLHGHRPDAELERYLGNADLVVNLRWPTMGEASYSQLRAFRHAVPTLVTRTGWYAELPNDGVIHISPGTEVDAIAAVLARLATDREELRRVGARGREHLVRRHAPEAYVDALLDFADSLPATRPAWERLAMRVAREIGVLGEAGVAHVLASIGQRMPYHPATLSTPAGTMTR